jgi:lysophospholipase L1-like esterase
MNVRHTRSLLQTAVLLIAAALCLIPATPAAASIRNHDYLALGDSVAFGHDPFASPETRLDPTNFVGYPEVLAAQLNLSLTNAACPGETTSGFLSLEGDDLLCRPYRSSFPLHVNYATSQLQYALDYLAAHPRTRLITLQLGSNDLFDLVYGCGGPTNLPCIQQGLPATFARVEANLTEILGQLLNDAKYRHQLLVVGYPAPVEDPLIAQLAQALNQILAKVAQKAGVPFVDGDGAFLAASADDGGSPCVAGLFIRPDASGPCDVHPSLAGQTVLADAIRAALIKPVGGRA